LNVYTVAFFGHRFIEHFFDAEDKVAMVVNDLIRNKEYVEFLVGRDGDFDQIASSTVRRAKTAIGDDNSSLVWVLPYQKAAFDADEDSFREKNT